MKKLRLFTLSAALSAFAFTSFSAAYACDGKNHDKTNASTTGKKQEKKAEEAAPPGTNQKSDQKS
jgi:hypothetical protein